jgi:hypothetical protein
MRRALFKAKAQDNGSGRGDGHKPMQQQCQAGMERVVRLEY